MPKFLALYTGSPPADGQPQGPPDGETIAKGMAAWGNWMGQHAAQIVDAGGPLGKTKKACKAGVSDTQNNVAGYIVVEAASHEAAAKMFEGHPHFAIFPGDGVEVMPVLPIPGT
jgi:hypothetical protein